MQLQGSGGYALSYMRQRVAPIGSAVARPKTVFGKNSYTYHGGGPALGALYSWTKAPSRTCGPQSLKAAAISCRRASSVILATSPSRTMSRPCAATAIEQRGSRARLVDFCVPGPETT